MAHPRARLPLVVLVATLALCCLHVVGGSLPLDIGRKKRSKGHHRAAAPHRRSQPTPPTAHVNANAAKHANSGPRSKPVASDPVGEGGEGVGGEENKYRSAEPVDLEEYMFRAHDHPDKTPSEGTGTTHTTSTHPRPRLP